MGKFIIKDVLIEKTSRNIAIARHQFSDSFNLICGDNEAGKSSLMEFIKNGFFKTNPVRTEAGKIYFEYNSSQYRAEVPDKTLPPVFYNENNQICDADFLDNALNKRYFNQGFTINLDDLHNSDNKEFTDFIEDVKDPSNDKLKVYLTDLEKEFYSKINRKAKEPLNPSVKKIYTEEILPIANKIKVNSTVENKYNEMTLLKNETELKIKDIDSKINCLSQINYLKETENELQLKSESGLTININNEIFTENSELLKEKIKIYNQNLKSYDICSKNLENLRKEISSCENKLVECSGIIYNNTDFSDFNYSSEDNRKISNLEDEINEKEKTLGILKAKISNIEELINNNELKKEKILISNNVSGLTVSQLKDLYNETETGIDEIESLNNKISTLSAENNNAEIINNKNSKTVMLVSTAAVISFVFAILGFIKTDYVLGIALTVLTILLSTIIYQNKKSNLKDNSKEISSLKDEQTTVFNSLKEKLNRYYPQIKDYYELKSVIKTIEKEIEICQVISETEVENTSKKNELAKQKEEFINIQNEISEKRNLINSIVYSPLFEKTKSVKTYIEATEILAQIKKFNRETLENKNNADIYEKENNKIINLLYSEINKKLQELTTEQTGNNQTIEELREIKKQLNSEKEEYIKALGTYISVEQNVSLMTKQNELIKKYKDIIKTVCSQKLAIEIINEAKSRFNKTQPNVVAAEKYLSILTDNRYSRIDLDGNKIANEKETEFKEWVHLSRGTKEQLCLALRLGYASNYSKDRNTAESNGKPDLPLIIDDAFVNFDPKRTKNALKCLLEFSKSNQVLFFTCHKDEIKNMLSELNATNETTVIEL